MPKEIDIKKFEPLIGAFQQELGGGLIPLVLFESRARGEGQGKAIGAYLFLQRSCLTILLIDSFSLVK